MIEILMYPFMQRALLAGIFVALMCGVLGILSVLRGSALYGDALAHASLAGVATALLLSVDPVIGGLFYALAVSFLLTLIEEKTQFSTDNLIALVLPLSMSLGVILLSFFSGYQPELISYLFGSILSVSWQDLHLLGTIAVLVLTIFFMFRKKFLFAFFDSEYAQIIKLKVFRYKIIYNFLLAFTVVVSIKVVGVILVNALLVLPTSIAKIYAKSVTQMLILTPLISLLSTLLGIVISYYYNLPTGPSITMVAGLIFGLSIFIRFISKKL